MIRTTSAALCLLLAAACDVRADGLSAVPAPCSAFGTTAGTCAQGNITSTTNTWSAGQTFLPPPTINAGTLGTGTFGPEGAVYSITATQSTGTGTAEQTLATYSLPAHSLDAAGRNLRIRAWFLGAANTDSKTGKCYFGAEVFTPAAIIASSKMALCELDVLKTGSSTQNVIGSGFSSTAITAATETNATETDTAAITIKATCTDGTSSAGDCALVAFTVEFLN